MLLRAHPASVPDILDTDGTQGFIAQHIIARTCHRPEGVLQHITSFGLIAMSKFYFICRGYWSALQAKSLTNQVLCNKTWQNSMFAESPS